MPRLRMNRRPFRQERRFAFFNRRDEKRKLNKNVKDKKGFLRRLRKEECKN